MNIIIDSRERDLMAMFSLLKPTDINIITQQLALGDTIIGNKIIIERKTLTDLAASIKDGRYREQSFRLQKSLEEGFSVIYMIEGNLDLYVGNITKDTLVRTMYSLTTKGFQVFLTKNVKETAYFIIQFAEKIKSTEIKTASGVYEETEGIIQKQKNTNITRDNISIFMLCQIPGISTVTATILMDNYKHITLLIKALAENPECLESFEYINLKTNKSKKLNKNVIKNIKEFL
jgi:ERCC4-type nuclease